MAPPAVGDNVGDVYWPSVAYGNDCIHQCHVARGWGDRDARDLAHPVGHAGLTLITRSPR